jgi:hypothetical protein
MFLSPNEILLKINVKHFSSRSCENRWFNFGVTTGSLSFDKLRTFGSFDGLRTCGDTLGTCGSLQRLKAGGRSWIRDPVRSQSTAVQVASGRVGVSPAEPGVPPGSPNVGPMSNCEECPRWFDLPGGTPGRASETPALPEAMRCSAPRPR